MEPKQNICESISESVLQSAWQRLLIAAFVAKCTLRVSTDRWGDDNYGWELTFPDDTDIFWMDINAEPGLQIPLNLPLFDALVAQAICHYIGITEADLDFEQ